ncbi:hypothetical protein E3T61_12400 [Cryobacterium lactosi]|uniref:DUF1648 domain-containing protein n=1 Tax=Cryobacterium lactosi TaxID=1259202 RepID=A0A4R9BPV0_9MICO|nr:hypothetical protein [Cryobacterium lactosi]TFD88619.1 hypothetical protein E3T61_12400 [Cryobacterium lactosi]
MPNQTITPEAAHAPHAPHATGRERFAAATLWLPVIAVSVTATLWYDRLPAMLPKQWNGAEVTSTAGTEIMIGITGAIALLGAIAGLIAVSDAAADIRRGLVLAAGCAAGLAAGVWLVTAGLVIATGSAEPDAGAWPLLAALAMGYGLIPFALSPRRPQHREPTTADPATVPLGATESGAWFTTMTVPMFLWLAGGLAVGAVALAVFSVLENGAGAGGVFTLLLTAGICLTFARLRVSVDRRGLRVVSSLLRLPIKQIALDQVASARAETIRPGEWGGWGYRILPGRSAIVLTSGPGIVVERQNGTLFAVTVPDPALPAALLTTLAAR